MPKISLVTITDSLIESGKSASGGYSKAQLAVLGVPWPPVSGWKKDVIGRQITSDAFAKFVAGGGGKGESHGKTGELFDQ